MPRKKTQKRGTPRRKADVEWRWREEYRVLDASRKIFLYPENWIEPKLRLTERFRASLNEVTSLIRARCGSKGVRILLAGKKGPGRLVAVRSLACNLGKKLYRIDLNAVVAKYIGETEKNLGRVFDGAKDSHAVLLFDEADALFGKRTDVKDSHDRYANIEVNYLLRRASKYSDVTILAIANGAKIDKALIRRFRFVIRIPRRERRAARSLPLVRHLPRLLVHDERQNQNARILH